MTTRLVLRIPEGQGYASLGEAAQQAIAAAGGRWASPMPGTQVAGGHYLADCLCANADPSNLLAQHAPGWQIIGQWHYSGGSLETVVAMDGAAILPHLRDKPVLAGIEVVGHEPAELHEAHRWAGWPACW